MENITIGIIGIIIIITGVTYSFYTLGKAATRFYNKANEIEQLILNNHKKEFVFQELMNLLKLSFHRQTGQRVRELALMYEVKYNEKILKR